MIEILDEVRYNSMFVLAEINPISGINTRSVEERMNQFSVMSQRASIPW